HREAFAGDAAEVAFALDGAVEHGIADDDRFLRHEAAVACRADNEAAAREALADIVVGVAYEIEGYPARQPGTEALAGGAGELDVDGVIGQAFVAVALGHLAGQHRAGGAVGVLDRGADPYAAAALECVLRLRNQVAVEDGVNLVVLLLAVVDRHALRRIGLEEQLGEVEALRLPVLDHLALVEHLHLADHLGEGAEAHRGHDLAHLFGHEEEEVDDVLGLANEALAQHRVLRGDADRTGVEVALAHHDAAGCDQRRGREAELVGAEQRADNHVAPGTDAAVDLHRDTAAQMVGDQRLVRLGKPDLPGRAGMLDRCERGSAGAAFEACDGHVVGTRLRYAGRDRADANLGDELDRDLALGIDVLEVED